jgi:hypothetical protein
VESTVAEVLILNGLGKGAIYELVTWVGRTVLGRPGGRRRSERGRAEARPYSCQAVRRGSRRFSGAAR